MNSGCTTIKLRKEKLLLSLLLSALKKLINHVTASYIYAFTRRGPSLENLDIFYVPFFYFLFLFYFFFLKKKNLVVNINKYMYGYNYLDRPRRD